MSEHKDLEICRWSYDHFDDTGSAFHATGCICKNSLTTSTVAAIPSTCYNSGISKMYFYEFWFWGNCL